MIFAYLSVTPLAQVSPGGMLRRQPRPHYEPCEEETTAKSNLGKYF